MNLFHGTQMEQRQQQADACVLAQEGREARARFAEWERPVFLPPPLPAKKLTEADWSTMQDYHNYLMGTFD